jgi:hypothetical protein
MGMNQKVNLKPIDPKQVETKNVAGSKYKFTFSLELDCIPDISWINRFNQQWAASFPTIIFDTIKQDIPYDTIVIETIHPERKEEIIYFIKDTVKKTNNM